jgi:hypothetical protein
VADDGGFLSDGPGLWCKPGVEAADSYEPLHFHRKINKGIADNRTSPKEWLIGRSLAVGKVVG